MPPQIHTDNEDYVPGKTVENAFSDDSHESESGEMKSFVNFLISEDECGLVFQYSFLRLRFLKALLAS